MKLDLTCSENVQSENFAIIVRIVPYNFFLISSMVLGLLNQLQIFWQLYLIGLQGLLTGLAVGVASAISKAFYMFLDAGLLHKLKPYGISGQMFALISSYLIKKGLQVVLDRKSPQEYSVNAGVTQCSIPGPTPFLLHINDLPDDVVCDITDYADDTTLYSKCVRHLISGNNSNWLLNLNLIYETLDWSRK